MSGYCLSSRVQQSCREIGSCCEVILAWWYVRVSDFPSFFLRACIRSPVPFLQLVTHALQSLFAFWQCVSLFMYYLHSSATPSLFLLLFLVSSTWPHTFCFCDLIAMYHASDLLASSLYIASSLGGLSPILKTLAGGYITPSCSQTVVL